METKRVCEFVSLGTFGPGEHYNINDALQAQPPSAYSSSTDGG